MTIWDRITHPEDALHERKPDGAGDRDFKETLTAFANSVPPGSEGVLFIGIADNGEIIGCSKGVESLQKTISKICSNDCYPPIKHQIESHSFDGKLVVAVIIPHSDKSPHFAGHAYQRRGPQNMKADEAAYSDFIVRRSSVGAKLLELRGTVVTIRTHGKKLGNPYWQTVGYTEVGDYRIEEVDSHVVKLRIVSSDERVYEQIENFSISRDPGTGNVIFFVKPTVK